MHELSWIMIFGSRVRRFANDFHKWRSHEWKSLVNCITSGPKIFIHGNECIILFLTCYFMPLTHIFLKPIIDRSFHNCRQGRSFLLGIVPSPQLICEVRRTQDTSIVMSYLLIFLAHTNWCKGDLHWWITTVNIDFSSPGIHGLECKETEFMVTFMWHETSIPPKISPLNSNSIKNVTTIVRNHVIWLKIDFTHSKIVQLSMYHLQFILIRK